MSEGHQLAMIERCLHHVYMVECAYCGQYAIDEASDGAYVAARFFYNLGWRKQNDVLFCGECVPLFSEDES